MKKILKTVLLVALTTQLALCTTKGNQPKQDAQSVENKASMDSMKQIPVTEAKIVILLAHPDIKKSHMNATLAQAAATVEGVQVINIYDYPVTPDTYREAIKRAKGIVYEFPCYWMSAPHLLKQWTDEVFMAFTQEGLIEGKEFMVAVTTGSEEAAYRHDGRNLYTMEEYMRPYEGQANHAKMKWNKPFVVYGNHTDMKKAEADLQAGAERYKQVLSALVKKVSEQE